jgi:excisionase family DNA binding protein
MSSAPKKYLSLEEAAARLGVTRDELVRMREHGEVRGFADRGTWKFRVEDVEDLARSRQADSSPDVPLLADDSGPLIVGERGQSRSDSSTILADDAAAGGEDLGEQPTVIRKKGDVQKTSDSDVKLAGDLSDSDSDVRLVSERKGKPKPTSDSDVKLIGADSDSEITLAAEDGMGSDSDVRLVPEPASKQGSDSDVQLIDHKQAADDSSDSDVALIGGSDSAVALDLDRGAQASVLSDDGGSVLDTGDSSMLLADSGISLESGSGVALRPDSSIKLADEEGITLAPSESGISLEAVGDSGISLEDSDEFAGTVPMMNALPHDSVEETKFEIPSLGDDDSAFDLQAGGSGEETSVLELQDSGETTLDDAVFDLDEGEGAEAEAADELEVAPDVLGEDDELEELDVFDADEGLFEESGASQEFAAPIAGRAVALEQEWSGGLVAGLAVSTVLLLLATIVSFDLIRTMWSWHDATPVSSTLLKMFGGGS